jgi:hypothetical protein
MNRFNGAIPAGLAFPFANGIGTSSNLQMIKGSPATSVLQVQNKNTKNFGVNSRAPKYPNSRNPSFNQVTVW